MTAETALPPESPTSVESLRRDEMDAPWHSRPLAMAALCATAGLIFYLLVDHGRYEHLERWHVSAATFVAVATLVFTLGVELRRLSWAVLFAIFWGTVMAFVGWMAVGFTTDGSPVQWPFLSGVLAVLVATPIFQTWRDHAPGAGYWHLWRLPYNSLHTHAWTDAVIGAAAMAFVGITFLLVLLIGQMFKLIGIGFIMDLLEEGWFAFMLAGAAFGGAVGLLRERDRLVGTLQRLVMIVLSVLAPLLAAALALFLLSLLGTGLTKLWDSGFSTAALMLAAAAFAVLLLNAVIGNGAEDRSPNRLLQLAAAVLAVGVLPLAIIAAVSMQARIAQYGWTPERLWGSVTVAIALAYGLAGLWAVVKGRRDFDDVLRPLQQKLAVSLMVLAFILALPIFDFGAISARDQLARLNNGTTKLADFDWPAMAFDFGPAGRSVLEQMRRSPDAARAKAATAALQAESRWQLMDEEGLIPVAPLGDRIRVLNEGQTITPDIDKLLRSDGLCRRERCGLLWVGKDHFVVLWGDDGFDWQFVPHYIRGEAGQWMRGRPEGAFDQSAAAREKIDVKIDTAKIEVREVKRRQVFVDGKPVGDSFE